MSARPLAFTGVIYPMNKMEAPKPVYFVGNAWDPGLEVGGGPVIPPDQPPSGGAPPQPIHPIWGPPGFNPPGPGMPPGIGGGPIIPPEPVPPDVTLPPPGSPPVVIPGTKPVNPIVPPPAIVVEYPGIGKVVVPQPVQGQAQHTPVPPAPQAPPNY